MSPVSIADCFHILRWFLNHSSQDAEFFIPRPRHLPVASLHCRLFHMFSHIKNRATILCGQSPLQTAFTSFDGFSTIRFRMLNFFISRPRHSTVASLHYRLFHMFFHISNIILTTRQSHIYSIKLSIPTSTYTSLFPFMMDYLLRRISV